jgi:regulator of nucleoside diphosphate kinase
VVVFRTEAAERLLSDYILSEELTERSMARLPQIYLTQNDMDHLLKLIEAQPGKPFEKLESELVRANVVSRETIPEDVVTMNSRVIFENETTRERREITLVYPGSADVDAGKISVLVPVGTALLGLRVGQSIDWELPGGEKQRFRIVEVPFQPEAAGEPG